MEQKYLTVTQLNTFLKRIIDSEELLKNICICGEVSGYSVSRNIAYFSLKDDNSLISVVMFDADLKYKPENGEKILLTGSINYYSKGGKISFNAYKIEKFGIGELYEQFLMLKEKLGNEGLFDASRKKQLPAKIQRVGVVTSKTGAVIQDIRNVGFRRNKNIELVLYSVKVQGDGAEKEIANAINFFSSYNVDVVIVARGGGSAEDLQPFNTEIVARAVANCEKPVVSAVGHETDFTIIDMVADLRAPTPSAAAELVFNDNQQLLQKVKVLSIRMQNSINYKFDNSINLININKAKLVNNISIKIANIDKKFNEIVNNLSKLSDKILTDNSIKIVALSEKLNALNPEYIFKLGYAFVRKDNQIISSIKSLYLNDNVTLNFIDGKAIVNVCKTEE